MTPDTPEKIAKRIVHRRSLDEVAAEAHGVGHREGYAAGYKAAYAELLAFAVKGIS